MKSDYSNIHSECLRRMRESLLLFGASVFTTEAAKRISQLPGPKMVAIVDEPMRLTVGGRQEVDRVDFPVNADHRFAFSAIVGVVFGLERPPRESHHPSRLKSRTRRPTGDQHVRRSIEVKRGLHLRMAQNLASGPEFREQTRQKRVEARHCRLRAASLGRSGSRSLILCGPD